MANAHIGTVYIKVSPDSKHFRKDVERQIGKEPLDVKVDFEVEKQDLKQQVRDAVREAGKGRHSFKIRADMDEALSAIEQLQNELNKLDRDHEIRFDMNHDSIVGQINKLYSRLRGIGDEDFTATVEVVPDEEGYRQALRRIDQIRRSRIQPIEIPLGLSDEELDAFEAKMQRELDKIIAKRPPETIKLSVDLDHEGLQAAIDEVDRRLQAIEAVDVEVAADKDSLNQLRDDLLELQNHSQLRVTYTHDEAGYRSVINKIDSLLNERNNTVTVDFDTDDASLRRVRDRMERALSWEPVMVKYIDDREGREAMIKRIQEELRRRDLELEVNLNVSDGELRRKMAEMQALNRRDWTVSLNPRVSGAHLAAAEALLSTAARDRWVNLKPRIVGSLVRDIQGAFMAIAGLNSIRTLVDQIRDIALSFDEWAIAVGTASAAIGSLVSVATTGLGAVLSIAGDTLEVFQGLAMAPALLLSGAAALQTWHAIWNDFGDAINGDNEALARIPENGKRAVAAIQDLDRAVNRSIQNGFWGEMTDEVERFTERIGPTIENVMGGTASVWGRTISTMLDHTERLVENGSLEEFTGNHLQFMSELGRGAERAFEALMNMGIQGSKHLPRLGRWVNELSNDFANFMNEAITSGKFDQWINNSINSLQSLGQAIHGTWDILAGFTRAFEAVGGPGLHEMADGLERIGDWVNRSDVQAKLQNIFRSAMDGAREVGRGFADLSRALWEYEADLSRMLVVTGQLAGDFMTQISRVDPTVAFRGFFDLMDGLNDFVNRAGPGFESIANIFGRLGSIGGEVAREIAHGMNLTMGAIDGFIARIEGPLINAIHPLTRVFEDVAALGTPVLFGLADSLGVVLNLFSALPAPIQDTITLLAIFNRTGLFAGAVSGLQNLQKQMAITRGTVAIQTAGIENSFKRMAVGIQSRARLIGSSLMGAFGGPWGVAVTAAIGGLAALAGASAEAEAAQQRLKDAVDETTGAVADQAVLDAYDQLTAKADGWWDKLNNIGIDMDSIFSKMGTSAEELARGLQAPTEEVREIADAARELSELRPDGLAAIMDGDFSNVSEGARRLYENMNLSELNAREFFAVMELIRDIYGPVADQSEHAKQRTEELGIAADDAADSFERFDGLAPGLQNMADQMKILADETSTAEQRVGALERAMRLLNGDDLAIDELQIISTESLHDGMEQIKQLAAEAGFDASKAFNEAGEFDLSKIEAVDIAGPMQTLQRGILAEMDIIKQNFDKGLIDQATFDQQITDLGGKWEGFVRQAAKAMNMTEAETEAFVDAWNNLTFDPKTIEALYDSAPAEQAQEDFKLLDELGLGIKESDYTASLDADGSGFIDEQERITGLGEAFDQLYWEAELNGDKGKMEEVLQAAYDEGYAFDGENFIAALDADGTLSQAAIDAALAEGRVFDGERFVAIADVETDSVTNGVGNLLNTLDAVWNGQEYITILGADGQPTQEALAFARSLGFEWDGSKFVASVDAEGGDNAREEVTQAREAMLRYQGVYRALLGAGLEPSLATTVASAIAGVEGFEGDYTAFLEAVQSDEGRAALEEFIDGLDGIDEEVKVQIMTALLGDAPQQLDELDTKAGSLDGKKIHPYFKLEGAIEGEEQLFRIEDHLSWTDAITANPSVSLQGSDVTTARLASHMTELDTVDGRHAESRVSVSGTAEAAAAIRDPKQVADDYARTYNAALRMTGGDSAAAAALLAKQPADSFEGNYIARLMAQGSGEVIDQAGGAKTAADTFAGRYLATLGVNGVGTVLAQAGNAEGSLSAVARQYIARLSEQGSGNVIDAAGRARTSGHSFATTYTGRLREQGSSTVIQEARATYNAAMRIVRTFTSRFAEVGASGVMGQARAVQAAINSINRNPRVVFTGAIAGSLWGAVNRVRSAISSVRAAASAAGSADGSLTGSAFKPRQVDLLSAHVFANGGFENHVAQIAYPTKQVPIRIWAEPETGGEAYIPLAPSKRARSLAIWEETGRRLGAFANGGLNNTGTPAAEKPRVQVNVTNHYPKAEPASRTVNDGLEYAAAFGLSS